MQKRAPEKARRLMVTPWGPHPRLQACPNLITRRARPPGAPRGRAKAETRADDQRARGLVGKWKNQTETRTHRQKPQRKPTARGHSESPQRDPEPAARTDSQTQSPDATARGHRPPPIPTAKAHSSQNPQREPTPRA